MGKLEKMKAKGKLERMKAKGKPSPSLRVNSALALAMTDVPIQVTPPGEAGHAVCTGVRLGCGVSRRAMVFEVIATEERLLTKVTLVGSFSCVIPHMSVPVGPSGEALPTMLTQIALMHLNTVVLQLGKGPELFLTILTDMGRALVIDSSVQRVIGRTETSMSSESVLELAVFRSFKV